MLNLLIATVCGFLYKVLLEELQKHTDWKIGNITLNPKHSLTRKSTKLHVFITVHETRKNLKSNCLNSYFSYCVIFCFFILNRFCLLLFSEYLSFWSLLSFLISMFLFEYELFISKWTSTYWYFFSFLGNSDILIIVSFRTDVVVSSNKAHPGEDFRQYDPGPLSSTI